MSPSMKLSFSSFAVLNGNASAEGAFNQPMQRVPGEGKLREGRKAAIFQETWLNVWQSRACLAPLQPRLEVYTPDKRVSGLPLV